MQPNLRVHPTGTLSRFGQNVTPQNIYHGLSGRNQ